MDQEIRGRVPFENCTGTKTGRPFCGDVFHRMDCCIDRSRQDCVIKRFYKDPLPSDLVKGNPVHGISLRGDGDNLRLGALIPEQGCDPLCLGQCKPAPPCSNPYRHDRYAALILPMSCSSWAEERKLVSNCDGGRKMPAFSMADQNDENRAVSDSFASR